MSHRVRIRIVKSSTISYVGYDFKRRRILVQWKKGGAWWAYPAKVQEYFEMLHADSIGKWVNQFLVERGGEKLGIQE